ncbi:MAG: METTL5 family protein [Candidatus Thermoplasmatota archaeon]|nr:METTL5 family protein [Candidatus Thermoplasmatota archaeon]
MKKKELEMLLQRAPPIPEPVAALEQISTPGSVAADMLYRAYAMGDIAEKCVADLGAGTGTFAVGAALLGASRVLALEISEKLVELGRGFCASMGVEVEWQHMDVSCFSEKVDTVLMNPPFGAQKKHADRPFLDAAIGCSMTIYTLCLEASEEFVCNYGGEAWCGEVITTYKFPVPYAHPFHRKERKMFEVSLIRLQERSHI